MEIYTNISRQSITRIRNIKEYVLFLKSVYVRVYKEIYDIADHFLEAKKFFQCNCITEKKPKN